MNLPSQKLGNLDRMETASIDELRHEQLQRLRWSVAHAYTNVPFYRKAFDEIGLKPMDIKSLDDLAKIPRAISTPGPILLPAAFEPVVALAATKYTLPTVTACSRVAWEPITVLNAWAVPSSPCLEGRRRNRFS